MALDIPAPHTFNNSLVMYYFSDKKYSIYLNRLMEVNNWIISCPVTMEVSKTKLKYCLFFFECKFHPKIDYKHAFLHYELFVSMNHEKINPIHHRYGDSLGRKCRSAQYLIYKEIGLDTYSKHLPYLWNRFPSLKVIAMVRNPVAHIPSWRRIVPREFRDKRPLNNSIKRFCVEQLHEIQYGLSTNSAYGMQRFFVFKSEEFFANITHKFNDTVKYYYRNVFDGLRTLDQVNIAYGRMLDHLWWANKKQPLRNSQKLKKTQKQSVANGCREFNAFLGY
eukprot:69934_1